MKLTQQVFAFWGLILFSILGLSVPLYSYVFGLREKLKRLFIKVTSINEDIDTCGILYGKISIENGKYILKYHSQSITNAILGENSNEEISFEIFMEFLSDDEVDFINDLFSEDKKGKFIFNCNSRKWKFNKKNNYNLSFFIEDYLDFYEENEKLRKKITNLENDVLYKESLLSNVKIPSWSHHINAKSYSQIEINEPFNNYLKKANISKKDTFNDIYFDLINQSPNQNLKINHNINGKRHSFLKITNLLSDNLIQGIIIDITDSEDHANDIISTKQLHYNVLQQLSSPIAIFNKDSSLGFYNDAYRDLFDFDEEFLKKKPLLSQMHDDLHVRNMLSSHKNYKEFKERRMELFNDSSSSVDEINHHPDGRVIRITISPSTQGGLVFIFADMSEQISLERKYNTLMAVQKETINSLKEGILVLGIDSKIQFYNDSFAKIWDLKDYVYTNDLLKKFWDQLKRKFEDVDKWDAFSKNINQSLHSRQPFDSTYFLSEKQIVSLNYIPLPDGSHLFAFSDISKKWFFEKEREDKNKLLENISKLKNNFISNISYEMKAPLNTTLGFVEILQNEYFGEINERQKDYCVGIRESSQKLLNVIDNMIEMSTIQSGNISLKIEEINIDSFLSNVIMLVYNSAYDSGIQLTKNNISQKTILKGDRKRLNQALFNLLNNAIKFTKNGGSVQILCEYQNNSIVFSVADSGVGVNKESLDLINEFFQMPSDNKNILSGNSDEIRSGIGLALVKNIIGIHGGSVQMESIEGKGTVIRCCIPQDYDC